MRRISDSFRAMLLDACNDVEFKAQQTNEYKEILRQLELKENQLVDEADKAKKRELLREIDEINMDRYNFVISAVVEMMATQSYMYELENEL